MTVVPNVIRAAFWTINWHFFFKRSPNLNFLFNYKSSRFDATPKGELQSDWFPDLRAISIKVLDPPGKSLVDDKPEQDFILVNHPILFASNLDNFVDVFKMLPILRTEKEEEIKAYIEKLPTAQRKKA